MQRSTGLPMYNHESLTFSDWSTNGDHNTRAAAQTYGTRAPKLSSSRSAYIRDQMTSKKARGGWD